jgi:hypothetical protein
VKIASFLTERKGTSPCRTPAREGRRTTREKRRGQQAAASVPPGPSAFDKGHVKVYLEQT